MTTEIDAKQIVKIMKSASKGSNIFPKDTGVSSSNQLQKHWFSTDIRVLKCLKGFIANIFSHFNILMASRIAENSKVYQKGRVYYSENPII
jgi:hypothetical protein